MSRRRFGLTLAAVVLTWAATPATAQPRMGMGGGMPRYDISTEATISGTVREVKTPGGRMGPGMGMCCGGGMSTEHSHVLLDTTTEVIEVHLGPPWFLDEQKLSVAAGDRVEVTGSRVTVAGSPALLARQVTKDGRTVTLRNEQGAPAWSGAQRAGRAGHQH